MLKTTTTSMSSALSVTLQSSNKTLCKRLFSSSTSNPTFLFSFQFDHHHHHHSLLQTYNKPTPPVILRPRTLSVLSSSASLSSAVANTNVVQKGICTPTSTITDPTAYLSCCMPDKKPLKIAVLLSGGVDSSVALRLLHLAGHSCTAFYLKIWFQEDFENFWSECPWEDDLKYARAVCDQVDVPLEVVHLTDEYWNNVVSYIIEEYRCGRTANPDVLCNTRIKFGAFLDAISAMNFDLVASGHYAKVVHKSANQIDEASVLELSKDMTSPW